MSDAERARLLEPAPAGDRAEAQPACEHYWAYHCYDGLSVRLCQLCHEPDWEDLRGQFGEFERKGALAERERGQA